MDDVTDEVSGNVTGAARDGPPRDEFEAAFGETLQSVLDVESWHTGEDQGEMYARITAEVAAAVRQEANLRDPIRRDIFPQIRRRGLVPGAGVYRATVADLKRVHQGLLFTGAVEACDATRYTHETLPLTVAQIGVSLVAYNGNLGTWVQRLFRRDLREGLPDPVDAALALLERRDERRGSHRPGGGPS